MKGKRVLLFTVAVFLFVTATGTGGVAAQEITLDIEFEDVVKANEETTITHVATVEEASAEVDAEVELTMLVDGEEVRTKTFEERVVEGKTTRTNFTHTFSSPGEKEVTFEGTISALGQELEDSVSETVTVFSEDATEVEVGPDSPGVVALDSTEGGVTVGNLTLESSQNTTAVVEFGGGEDMEGPANSLRVVSMTVQGDGISSLSLSYETDANVSVHRMSDGEWTRDGVSMGNGTVTVEQPPASLSLAFVDQDAAEEEEEMDDGGMEDGMNETEENMTDDETGDESSGDEGLPGFGFLAAVAALLGGAALRKRSE